MAIQIYRDTRAGSQLLGSISKKQKSDSVVFAYDENYLTLAQTLGQLGLSQRLPLSKVPYGLEEFGPFFQGLLPEGEVLGGLAQRYQVPRNDYLAILEKLGCESIGALTFLSDTIEQTEPTPSYEPLSQDIVQDIRLKPFQTVVNETSSTRLSLAGAQMKLAWALPEGADAKTSEAADWLIPYRSAPSTHIIKISRSGEEDIALNECACAALAVSCGIETAEVTPISWLPGGIAVKRYDRLWIDDNRARRVLRLHQEDFCQALGFYTTLKYQPEGINANYPKLCGGLIEEASMDPHKDLAEYAKRLLFNYVIGNTDAHLKNSSLLYNEAWTARRLAPLYDVTCIPLTAYSTKMAFEIGQHRELSEITEQDILSIAVSADVSFDNFFEGAQEIVSGFENYSTSQIDGATGKIAERIVDNAQPRLQVVRRAIAAN